MTHKKFNVPDNEIYVPLHVGKAVGADLGYDGDDTGDNISELNKYYGELTGVYWVWRNVTDADYVGVCHYRRYFLNDNRELMNAEEYEKILKEYDIITSNAVFTEKSSYKEDYGDGHNVNDLLIVGEVIKEKYPDYYESFENAINGNLCYYGNLMVTSKELFDSYAEWLFDVLSEAAMHIDVSSYNLYEQRVYGFLSEQLLRVWVMKNNLKVYEGTVGIVAEKAETVELKLAMKQLVKLGSITQARQMFYEFMKLRPDVRLELSDVKGEIPVIEQLLYVAEEEKNRGIQGLLHYSNDLTKLIKHYFEVQKYIIDLSKGNSGDEAEKYIIDNSVSWILIKIMILNPLTTEIQDVNKAAAKIQEIYKKAGMEEYCKKLAE